VTVSLKLTVLMGDLTLHPFNRVSHCSGQMPGKACVQDEPDADLVRGAWERLLPGLLQAFDSPASLPCIAPRPLLVVNGAADGRCPVGGLAKVLRRCRRAYKAHGCSHLFEVFIDQGAGHQVTDAMDCVTEDFFVRTLKPALPKHQAGAMPHVAADEAPAWMARASLPRPSRVHLGRQRSCLVHAVPHDAALMERRPSHRRFEDEAVADTPV
jgi:hypothetical protein